MTSKDKKISFVGVGRMGANMARHLRDRGYDLGCVYDINTEIAAELARELECSHAQSLSELTEKSDIVLTVVTGRRCDGCDLFWPRDNLFKGAKNTLFINCEPFRPWYISNWRRPPKKSDATPSKGAWPQASRRPEMARFTL